MARYVLVTGTDTGVGKTVVTAGLGHLLTKQGLRTLAVKPVESGCDGVAKEDGTWLQESTGQPEPQRALTRLRAPVAPPVAADREGVDLDPENWLGFLRRAGGENDVVLIEGAGGALSPITWSLTALDLAKDLGASVLVVAPNRLGMQNHVLLTHEALQQRNLRMLGIILVDPEAPDASTPSNADALRRFADLKPILLCPRVQHPHDLRETLEPVVSWILKS
jgi:dethiobiotin synthetase